VVDLVGVDEIAALAPADEEPVPLAAGEREAGDAQRLPLRSRASSPSRCFAPLDRCCRTFDTTPSRPTLHACANISWPSTSKLSLNWTSVPAIIFFSSAFQAHRAEGRRPPLDGSKRPIMSPARSPVRIIILEPEEPTPAISF